MTRPRFDAIVLGASPTGLYAVRELAKAGLSVAVADVASGCTFQSRYVRDVGRRFCGELPAVETWLLERASAGTGSPVLVPTNDIFIEYVLGNAARLAESFCFASAYQGVAFRLLDKLAFHALCKDHDMATPGVWHAEGREALLALAGEVPYPCILKPTQVHRSRAFLKGKKVLLAKDRAAFVDHVSTMPPGFGSWLVQEIVPGPESAITLFGGYIDCAGLPSHVFTGRKLRQFPPGFGSASLVTSASCKETERLSLSFLERIGFRGICGAEFKRDPRDGVLKVIEINPRPTLWFQATHDAGLRVVEAAVRDLGQSRTLPAVAQNEDMRWRYGLKDLASAWFYRRSAGAFILPPPDVTTAAKEPSWPVFAASDPLPAFFEPLGYLRKAWRRRK